MKLINTTPRKSAIAASLGLVLAACAVAQISPPEPVATPPTAATDDFLPEAFNPQEHASTWEKPPFSRQVLAPQTDGPVDLGPQPWDGWQIAAVDRFGGKFTVGLVTKKNEFRLIKEGEMSEDDGVMVTKVESTGVITDTVVHVSDGGSRTGTITFESKRLTAAPKGAPAPKAAPRKAAPRVPTPTRATTVKPQAAATRRGEQQLADHLNKAAAGGAQPAQPAAGQPAAAATPQPTTRTRRRAVVLPPSTR